MHLIDWILAVMPLLIVLAVGLYTHRYVNSVAQFMAGGRVAGRYLLAVAGGELQAGAVVFVAVFEVIAHSGFTIMWWGYLSAPVGLLVAISGFVIYRYRETRAMTLAQFFEIRYSKSFRVATGILGFVAGILNFGIIPAVGARFLVFFIGLPPSVTLFSTSVPTFVLLMGTCLSISLFVALTGGIVTVMVANCLEGIISQLCYLAIIFALLKIFHWHQISDTLGYKPPGHSLLNPFDSASLKDFNLWYILMSIFVGVYGTMAWQNSSSYNSAAATPHESRMAGILGRWRELGKGSVVTLLGICAVTFLTHPDFRSQAAPAMAAIHQIADGQMREQMTLPIGISHLLPTGIKGVFCAVLLMGIFGGDATHLHSWGSIFIQDVLVPLRRKPFTPRQHIRLLRISIAGVALFAFLFGSMFHQLEYIVMWFGITTAIYVGGAGAAIIGGLYWKKGTTAGAWSALLLGSFSAIGGIILRQIYGSAFPLNGMQVFFFTTLAAMAIYAFVSLATSREDFDIVQMLHRQANAITRAPSIKKGQRYLLSRLLELDANFTSGDKWIAFGLLAWSGVWLTTFLAGTCWNILAPWPLVVWSTYWHIVGVGIPVLIAAIIGVWFSICGVRDMRRMFGQLRRERINPLDDGTVIDHQNLDEAAGHSNFKK